MAKDRKLTFTESSQSSTPQGKNYLLVIGINEYEHFTHLNNAVRDAETIRDILLERYQFEEGYTTSLLNGDATRENILESLYELEEQIISDDNLLLYFAGHGVMNRKGTKGFWIPVEAQQRFPQYIDNTVIRDILRDIDSHHTYLMVDSCFSGSMILRGENEEDDLIYNLPSRRVLTSGRKQVVSDGAKGGHSPFARCIIEYLKRKPGEGIAALDLEYHVQKNTPRTANQHPEAAFIFGLGDQSGQFVFAPRVVVKEVVWEDLEGNLEACQEYVKEFQDGEWLEYAYWEIARLTDLLRDYLEYVRRYSRGTFINEALAKIDSIEEKQAFNTAKNNGLTGLVRFINRYPNSQYVKEAEDEIKRLTTPQINPVKKKSEPVIEVKTTEIKPESKVIDPALGPIKMVFVEGGTFMMGSEDGADNEKPDHPVKLSSFYIGKYPITQQQWVEIMFEVHKSLGRSSDYGCPVEPSWHEIQKFIHRLNQKYPGLNYRLPTEAEWEYAARGGKQSQEYIYSGSNYLDEVGWFIENHQKPKRFSDWLKIVKDELGFDGGLSSRPVGYKKPNELGIYDMSGNVWEWCSDYYDQAYYQSCFQQGEIENPLGPKNGEFRVVRGGSWFEVAKTCRSISRGRSNPDSYAGFRVAAFPSQ